MSRSKASSLVSGSRAGVTSLPSKARWVPSVSRKRLLLARSYSFPPLRAGKLISLDSCVGSFLKAEEGAKRTHFVARVHSLAKKVDSSTSLLSFEKARSPGRLGLGRLSKSVLRSRTSYPLRGEALVSKESPIAIGSYVWVLCYGISAVSK
ncbi:unnamed protein product, partial [Dovyalis caffra]